jgi:hypothetical protein
MTMERGLARAFALDDEGWRRHANPWSVWTRVATLPLIVLAVWSRAWIGRWSLVPIALVAAWTWINPRLFPAPRSTESWASRGVMGERVWLNRDRVPVPARHRLAPHLLTGVAASGAVLLIWGLARLEPWPTLTGTVVAYLGKLWFVDRMAWLYEDMKDATPEYRGWSEPAPTSDRHSKT